MDLPGANYPFVVAIPARDEAGRVVRCLDALRRQEDNQGRPLPQEMFCVALLVNNTQDETAERARRWSQSNPIAVKIKEVRLPVALAHAGGARAAAMDWAARFARPGAVLCSTDADSQVGPRWLIRMKTAFDLGVDAVAGVVEFDAASKSLRGVPEIRRLESVYSALQAEMIERFDPEDHNPWPNHIWMWGANFAVTLDAYRAVGGVPTTPLAEDRAFAAALRRHDFKIRHALDIRVQTSSRDVGRAPGGLADLIRLYASDHTHPCDAQLEPAATVFERASAQRITRQAWISGGQERTLASRLHLTPAVVERALKGATFGKAWEALEAASPKLQKVRLHPTQLPLEIQRAERWLGRVSRVGVGDPTDTPRAATAGLWTGAA